MKIPMNKKYRKGLIMDPETASLKPVDRNHYEHEDTVTTKILLEGN